MAKTATARPAPAWIGLPLIGFIWLVGILAFYYLATAQSLWAATACITAVLLMALVAPRWMLPYAPMLVIVPATVLGLLELGLGFRLGSLDAPLAPPVPTEQPAPTPLPGDADESAAPAIDQPKVSKEQPTAEPPPPAVDVPKVGREPIAPKEQLAPAVIDLPKEGKVVPETVYVMAPAPAEEKVSKATGDAPKGGKERKP